MHTIGLVNTNNQMLTDRKRGIPFGKEKTRENTVGIRETDGVCRTFPDPDLSVPDPVRPEQRAGVDALCVHLAHYPGSTGSTAGFLKGDRHCP